MSDQYRLVQLANGAYSLRSEIYGETFHPVIGPVAEAQSLYVDQLQLVDQVRRHADEFVIWDVGLGAAANSLTFLNAVREVPARVTINSFDYTTEPLRLAFDKRVHFPYFAGWESAIEALLANHSFSATGPLHVEWKLHLADFPTFLKSGNPATLPKPHAVFYDAFSPATNPAMWTLDIFRNLYRCLDPARPCTMPTYSRSTILRVTLLLAGFYVGRGHATGEKEETTLASNSLSCLAEPLDRAWLMRCKRSRSAEPLHSPFYRQSPLSDATWGELRAHAQFQ